MKAIVQPAIDLLGRKHADAGGGEFDGQGNSVQPPANLGDDERIFGGQRKAGLHGRRPLDKEPQRFEFSGARQNRSRGPFMLREIGEREGLHRVGRFHRGWPELRGSTP